MSTTDRARILIADDMEDNLEILKTGLEFHGYDVLIAKDGQAALDLARRESPDCVLLDVMMPQMSGFEVCRRLKAETKGRSQFLPILLVTAREDLDSKLHGLEKSLADDYIVKPYALKELVAKVRVMLRIKQLQESQVEAERLKVLLETTGAVAHELNQPLCALTCHIELLLRKVEATSGLRAEIEGMAHCVDRLTAMVRRLSEIKRYMTKSYLMDSTIIDLDQSSRV